MDEQHPKRQFRELYRTSTFIELYGCGDGGVSGEGQGADGGEDDTACWTAAGGAGLRGRLRDGTTFMGCMYWKRWGGEDGSSAADIPGMEISMHRHWGVF